MDLMQKFKRFKKSISNPSINKITQYRLSSMITCHCRCKEMSIRSRFKDVKIRCMILLLIVMYHVQMIQVKITSLWFLRKTSLLKKWILWVSYYIKRIQRRYIMTKRRQCRAKYPHHSFMVVELDNAEHSCI